jgi:LCP family protein required for cell wall assembly
VTGHTSNDMMVDAASAPRHGRMPRHGALPTYLKLGASVIAVLAVSAAAVASWAAIDLVTSLKPSLEVESEAILEGVPDIGAMEGGLNFLVVGSDKRPVSGAFGDPEEESGERNDVTMLLHISQDHSHVEVVSFPRDMLVEVPECANPEDPAGEPLSASSDVKINTVLQHGGFSCVALTVEQLTGVTIPAGGIVEFDGVAALATAVGGVEVCLAERIDDDEAGLHLDAGVHSISGYDALAFLRSRHGVGDGSDLGRISNQQTFLASLIRTVKSVTSNMRLTSQVQDPVRLISIAKALQDIDLSKVAFIQYPTGYTDDSSAVVPTESAQLVNAALEADLPVQLDPTANDNTEFGTAADPAAPAEPAPAPAEETPADPAATTAPTTPAQPLPPDVTGQSGADVRCSTANAG